LEVQGTVATVQLDRPAKLNACTEAMYRQLAEAFAEIGGEVRCVVLRGAGHRAFSAGSDIGEFLANLEDRDRFLEAARVGRAAADALRACPHPTVALVEGLCVGGGLMLAAACDLRLASESSRFGVPIKALGIFAEYDDLGLLLDLCGPAALKELLFTGRLLDAREAEARGLVNRVVLDGELEAAGRALVEEIAAGAPLSARWHKAAIDRLRVPGTLDEEERRRAFACLETDDFREGCAAFVEKRAPSFRGQ
jgi:enoyl-CoA hydratase/carnithine racemase